MNRTRSTLSPREFGRALGVSESSVKRWIDAGRLPARITSGGHRRVDLVPALRFVRASGRKLVDPVAMGFSDPETLTDPHELSERVFAHLSHGRGDELERDLLAVLSIGALPVADLFDGPLRSAMQRIGEMWRGADEGIFVEHRATQTMLHALDVVHPLFAPPESAPVAVGSSMSGDPSLIPTRMASTVLSEAGYRVVDLGASMPAPALREAVAELDAQLLWLSVSYVTDAERERREIEELVSGLANRGTPCVLGGREIDRLGLPGSAEQDGRAVRIGRDMRDLSRLARQLLASAGANGTTEH